MRGIAKIRGWNFSLAGIWGFGWCWGWRPLVVVVSAGGDVWTEGIFHSMWTFFFPIHNTPSSLPTVLFQANSVTSSWSSLILWGRLFVNAPSTLWRSWMRSMETNCISTSARLMRQALRLTDRYLQVMRSFRRRIGYNWEVDHWLQWEGSSSWLGFPWH